MALYLPNSCFVIDERSRNPYLDGNFEILMENFLPELWTNSSRKLCHCNIQKSKQDKKEIRLNKEEQTCRDTTAQPVSFIDILFQTVRQAMADAPEATKRHGKAGEKTNEKCSDVEAKKRHAEQSAETNRKHTDAIVEVKTNQTEIVVENNCDQADDVALEQSDTETRVEISSEPTDLIEAAKKNAEATTEIDRKQTDFVKTNKKRDEGLIANEDSLLTPSENCSTIQDRNIPIQLSAASEYELRFNLEGCADSLIKIHFVNGLLTVTGKKEEDEGIKTISYERKIPSDVDSSSLTASFLDDGTLKFAGKKIVNPLESKA